MRTYVKNQACPMCAEPCADKFHQDERREYYRCSACRLVFVPSPYYLSEREVKTHYDQHQNSPDDPRYRQFLNRLFVPLEKNLSNASDGLDFGSGPGPALSVMFEEKGHHMRLYDYFYAPDTSVFDQQYDFVTVSETVEHLHDPRMDLNRLWGCLKPRGRLGIMTKLVVDRKSFVNWYYKNEPSHVCFFSKATFQWLAGQWQADLDFAHEDVVIFSKN